eukprot:scaffold576_cov260-Pinguiococcus_pyrenoidosus.AAC.48
MELDTKTSCQSMRVAYLGSAEQPLPRKECQRNDVHRKECNTERLRYEDVLAQKLEVHRPLVHEDSAQVESTGDVLHGIRSEEGQADDELDQGADRNTSHGACGRPVGLEQQQEQPRREEKHVHLDANSQRVHDATKTPSLTSEEQHGHVQHEHGHAVVEEPQHENRVQPLRQAQQPKHVERHSSSPPIQPEDRHLREQVQPSEDALSSQDGVALPGQRFEQLEHVHEGCWVHERPRIAAKLAVVRLSGLVAAHFLHVGHPVDLRVGHSQDDRRADDSLEAQQQKKAEIHEDVVRRE